MGRKEIHRHNVLFEPDKCYMPSALEMNEGVVSGGGGFVYVAVRGHYKLVTYMPLYGKYDNTSLLVNVL